MKIKQRPEDFQVEEVTDAMPASGSGEPGRVERPAFAFYRLEKRGWTTHDAIQVICRRWQLDQRRVSYGGLKDRHAQTVQYLTIVHGPERNLTHQRLTLTFLGHVAEAYRPSSIRSNRFRIAIRALTAEQIAVAEGTLAEVRVDGIANYFDDQRFGSVAGGGQFMARALVAGQYEEALRRALLNPYEHDRAPQKREKAILRDHWGDWSDCKALLPRCHARDLVDYLSHHPGDFEGALERLRPELRGLYLSAYQSYLWNRMLARWLVGHVKPEQLISVRLCLGDVPMHRGLESEQREELAKLELPLPSGRIDLDAGDPRLPLLNEVLKEEGLEAEQLRLKRFKEIFFSRGERAALFIPFGLEHESSADDLNRGRQKLLLAFELPRGCYATLVVKRITQEWRG